MIVSAGAAHGQGRSTETTFRSRGPISCSHQALLCAPPWRLAGTILDMMFREPSKGCQDASIPGSSLQKCPAQVHRAHCPSQFTDQRHREGEESAKGHIALEGRTRIKTSSLGTQPTSQMVSQPQTQRSQPGCLPVVLHEDLVTPHLFSARTSSNSTPSKVE